MKKTTTALSVSLVIIVAAGAAIYASPYLTMLRMRSSIDNNDAQSFAAHVDFPALRDHLRVRLSTMLQRKIGGNPDLKGNGVDALGMMLVMGMANQAIDTMVTPAGAMAIVSQGKANTSTPGLTPSAATESPGLSSNATPTNYSVRYKDWSTAIATANEGHSSQMSFVFKREGLWSWKLTGVDLPLDSLLAGLGAENVDAAAITHLSNSSTDQAMPSTSLTGPGPKNAPENAPAAPLAQQSASASAP